MEIELRPNDTVLGFNSAIVTTPHGRQYALLGDREGKVDQLVASFHLIEHAHRLEQENARLRGDMGRHSGNADRLSEMVAERDRRYETLLDDRDRQVSRALELAEKVERLEEDNRRADRRIEMLEDRERENEELIARLNTTIARQMDMNTTLRQQLAEVGNLKMNPPVVFDPNDPMKLREMGWIPPAEVRAFKDKIAFLKRALTVIENEARDAVDCTSAEDVKIADALEEPTNG